MPALNRQHDNVKRHQRQLQKDNQSGLEFGVLADGANHQILVRLIKRLFNRAKQPRATSVKTNQCVGSDA